MEKVINLDDLYELMVQFDQKAFEEFFVYLTPQIFERLLSWGLAPDDAENVALWFVREIAIIAPSEEPTVKRLGFEVWIRTVTRNTFVRHWRDQ